MEKIIDTTIESGKGKFGCPGCSQQVSEFGAMRAIAPRAASAAAFVFFLCSDCAAREASLSEEQRTWVLEKIEKRLQRNTESYSAVRATSSQAALQIVADFYSSGVKTRNPVAALAAGITGPARRAETAKQAKASADRDDAQWFDQNLHRYYRLRAVLPNELDDVEVGYSPKAVLVIQLEPGKRSKALLPTGSSAWPNEDEFLEGALLAATEQTLPVGNAVKMQGWQAWVALMGPVGQ